jgi:hypothetical protein
VAPPCALRAVEPGVLGPFGAVNGPVGVGVGVIARVEAAMVCEVVRQVHVMCVFKVALAHLLFD